MSREKNDEIRLIPYRGGLALVGPRVQEIAHKWISACQDPALQSSLAGQRKRDGLDAYHITVMIARERKKIKRNGQWSNAMRVEWSESSCCDLGIGRVKHMSNQAFFVILKFPAINRFRASVGLGPIDPHITLGFQTMDIHGIPKDIATLWFEGDEQTTTSTTSTTTTTTTNYLDQPLPLSPPPRTCV